MLDKSRAMTAGDDAAIEQADRILVMDHGELAESGSKEVLLAQGGIYAGMVKAKQAIERDAASPEA